MRLQLIAAATLVSAVAHAQPSDEVGAGAGQARVLIYDDDDETTVITSTVDAQAVVPGHVDVGAHALIDAVSSASIDVVTAATERWTENRIELGGRIGTELSGFDVLAAYTRSQENDWASDAIRVGVGRDLFQRNARVEAGYALILNDVGRAGDPTFSRSLTVHMADVSISQLVDKVTRVGGSLTAQRLDGYQSSPYRFVAAGATRVPERHPDSRTRLSASGFGVRSLTRWLAVRGTYRVYADDWGVRSHTAKVRVAADFAGRWHAAVTGRLYYQGDAEFYRSEYSELLAHVTADRELSTFWDAGASAQVSVDIGPMSADARFGFIHYRFDDFEPLPQRTALIAGAGIGVGW